MCSLVMVGRRRKEEESRRESILLCPEKVTQIRSRQKEAKNERSQQKGKSRIPFLYFYFFGLQTTAGTSLVQIRMKWSQNQWVPPHSPPLQQWCMGKVWNTLTQTAREVGEWVFQCRRSKQDCCGNNAEEQSPTEYPKRVNGRLDPQIQHTKNLLRHVCRSHC